MPAAFQKPFPYPCYVINLDRQPERLAAFREWNAGCGLDIKRFAAVEGKYAGRAREKRSDLVRSTHTRYRR